MSAIKACGSFAGQQLNDIPVLNPGDWFGKAWLLELGGSYWPLFLVVEADSVTDAIDELADHDKYAFHVLVPDADLGDCPEDERHYGSSGQVLDLDHLLVHGREGTECPFPCLYHGDGLPPEGVTPTEFGNRDDE